MATKKPEAAEKGEERQKRCFFITPIGGEKSPARQHADWVFYHAIQPVFESKGYQSTRADLIRDPFMINDSVFEAITEADICVADLTLLNANVFYELGIRHAIEKPVIHIAQFDTVLPFDNAGYRTILFDRHEYQSMQVLKEELGRHIEAIEKPEFILSNPLTQYRGRERLAESADSRDQILQSLQGEVESLRRSIAGLKQPVKEFRPAVNNVETWTNPLLILRDRPNSAVETLRAYGVEHAPTTASAVAAAEAAAATQRELEQIDRDNAAFAALAGYKVGEVPPGG